MFVFAIICWVVGIIVLAIGLIIRNGWTIAGGIGVGLLGFMFLIFSTYFTVEPGEAKVMKDWTGVINQTPVVSPGPYWKAPWEDAIDFDVRNQLAVFLGDGNETYNGAPTNGPQITFTDKDGVTANMDLVVLYSIKPDAVVGLVENYQNQDDFRTKVIEQDIRSVPRDIPGRYTTIQMMTDRVEVANEIRKALEAEWEDKGIVIEDVSLQEVRYSDAVKARFEEAQNAQTEVVKAEAEAEKAKIQADSNAYVTQTEATAEANANNTLAASLTANILQQRYLDVLAGANLIVVPQGFTALGQIPSGAQ
jgi:regulator of protease activity HflC (stomatin/prohibitin superfamily)